jgi:transcriptional regulator with XRE-family HTH domain
MTALINRSASALGAEEQMDRLGDNIRRLRRERSLTLEAFALKSGVSRAMISKIERGDAIPTATVLGKLAAGFEIGLTQLIGGQKERAPLLLRPVDQPVFRDPESGLERRSLSPFFSDRSVDFALNTLPAHGYVSFPGHDRGVEEYLYVQRGSLVVVVGEESYAVACGSSLFYHAHVVHEFHNQTDDVVEFFIMVDRTGAR